MHEQVLNFGLGDFLTVDCDLQASFYPRLLMYTLGPPLLAAIGAGVCWLYCRRKGFMVS
jgi:hypothetical protein